MIVRKVIETIVREHDRGRPVAICVVLATRGSVPQPAGAMVCVDELATLTGTLGGGCVEAEIRRRAHHALIAKNPTLATLELDNDFGYDDGMICGGSMDVAICPFNPTDDVKPFRDALSRFRTNSLTIPLRVPQNAALVEYRLTVEPSPRLLIAGAGHIARILANMAVSAGFGVHVIDDRRDYANPQRFPDPIHTHVGDIAATLAQSPIDADTYVVIVTRGHKRDETALQAVLHSSARYIGMIGSRRKTEVTFNDLRHAGASEQSLQRVHAPIGLPIGALTPEEIAVSILAELIQVRRAVPRPAVQGPFPLDNRST